MIFDKTSKGVPGKEEKVSRRYDLLLSICGKHFRGLVMKLLYYQRPFASNPIGILSYLLKIRDVEIRVLGFIYGNQK